MVEEEGQRKDESQCLLILCAETVLHFLHITNEVSVFNLTF